MCVSVSVSAVSAVSAVCVYLSVVCARACARARVSFLCASALHVARAFFLLTRPHLIPRPRPVSLQHRQSALFDPVKWSEATELFIKDNATLAGLPSEEPLLVCVNAGCTALPKLMKVVSVLQAEQSGSSGGGAGGLWARDELPVEVDLGQERLYHSVFACPVSREMATKANPPMRLPCGHAICIESLRKIAATSHVRDPSGQYSRFKCTYCPSEQTLADAKPLYF